MNSPNTNCFNFTNSYSIIPNNYRNIGTVIPCDDISSERLMFGTVASAECDPMNRIQGYEFSPFYFTVPCEATEDFDWMIDSILRNGTLTDLDREFLSCNRSRIIFSNHFFDDLKPHNVLEVTSRSVRSLV